MAWHWDCIVPARHVQRGVEMMNPNEAEDKLIIDSCRNDLLSYAMAVHPKFVANDFAEAVCWEIQNCLEGDVDRLMLFAPPRHGKSFITSETAPAWYLGKYHSNKVIAASHTAELAFDMGAKVKELLADPVHQMVFGAEGSLNKQRAASDNFRTNASGQYFGVGVGGTPIGKGADVYIIDDPIRSRSDVESEKQREDLKSWYSSAVLSRLEGKGKIILMHQRWHEDDLAGWLLREFADDGWRVASFPALIEDPEDHAMDYLNRDYGEPLIPQLHSKEKLERLKKNMLKRDWLSMYQQRPAGASGDKFTREMWLRYEGHPVIVRQNMNVYICVDPADGKGTRDDYTAMAVIGLGADGNFYLLDLVRERLDLAGRARTLIDLHRRWRPIAVGYEKYGAQADIQHIKFIQELENYRFPITEFNTRLTKNLRIERLIPDMSNGRWYAPEGMVRTDTNGDEYEPLERMIEDEMLPFPLGKHDDALDAVSRIYDMPVMWPSGSSGSSRPQGPKVSPW